MISIHTFGAGLIVCKIGKGGLLRFSVFLLLDDLDFMVRAKEALNGIPLLEILFHAYIVSVLKGCYCCFFLFVTIMIILIVNSRSLSHSQPSHFNWRFLLRRSSFRALAAALTDALYWTSEIKAHYSTDLQEHDDGRMMHYQWFDGPNGMG